MERTGYNGYTNYETWAVNLWLSNEQGLYYAVQEIVADHWADDYRSQGEAAEAVKDWLTEQMPEVEGLWADLLNGAISEVNWSEVAEAFAPEPEEEEPEEEEEVEETA